MQEPTYHLEGIVRAKQDNMEDFSGPLDLILSLLSKNKIQIRDIRLSLILDQYLAYLDEMKRMDLEIASEFVVMASHLMQLKTKMLLTTGEDEEVAGELELLMRSLEDRKRQEIYGVIRQAAETLAPMAENGLGMFAKRPEPLRRSRKYEYKHDRRDLLIAMNGIMERNQNALPPPMSAFSEVIEQQPFPAQKKARQIIRRLIAVGSSRFKSLFQGSRSRSEIVATFVAVLELCRMGTLRISDDEEQQVSYVSGSSGEFVSEME